MKCFIFVFVPCLVVFNVSSFSGLSILDCPFCFLWIVHSWLPLLFSLTFIWYTGSSMKRKITLLILEMYTIKNPGFLLPKTFKLFGFAISYVWAYTMTFFLKRVVRTKLDIYVFIKMFKSGKIHVLNTNTYLIIS